MSDGVDYRHCAVAVAAGTAILNVPRDLYSPASGSMNPMSGLAERRRACSVEHAEVPAVSLDDAVETEGLAGSLALRIDVEGAQREVLAEAGRALSQAMAVFIEGETANSFVEGARANEVIRTLREQGLVPIARDTEARCQFNVLFLRGDLLRRHASIIAATQAEILKIVQPYRPPEEGAAATCVSASLISVGRSLCRRDGFSPAARRDA